MSYTIEKFRPEFFNDLVPLMHDCFGIDVNKDYFEWKYLKNPAGYVVAYVARSEGRIIAFYGVIPETYFVDGVKRTIYQSCDTMTHSEFRRRGLFQMLARETYKHLEESGSLFIIGFGGPTSTPGFLKMGWTHQFDVRHYFKPNPLIRLDLLFERKGDIQVNNIALADAADYFPEPPTPRPGMQKVLDRDYVSWRLANPNVHYEALVAGTHERERGIAIYSTDSPKLNILYFYSPTPQAGRSLMQQLHAVALNKNLKVIYTFTRQGSTMQQQLKALGFLYNPFPFGPLKTAIPLITLTREDQDHAGSMKTWDITPMEHDSF